jgi:hypothetical protein
VRVLAGIAIVLCAGLSITGAQNVPVWQQNLPPLPTNNDLELRLQPGDIHDGVPESFSFSLVNKSGHDIQVDTPAFGCGGSQLDGRFMLKITFTPLPGRPGVGMHYCTNDAPDKRTISERMKTWKVLHHGESIVLQVTRKDIPYSDQEPGTYEFSASYYPPDMTADDRKMLIQAGVVFPPHVLTTAPVRFIKRK